MADSHDEELLERQENISRILDDVAYQMETKLKKLTLAHWAYESNLTEHNKQKSVSTKSCMNFYVRIISFIHYILQLPYSETSN